MSLLDRNCIRVIAESVGVASVSDEVADALAPDIEYRLRDIVAEALKFMRHGRRETLSCDDINFALRARSCEPLYGFATTDPPRFCRAAGTGDVFYLDDPELNLSDLMAVPLPPMPRPPSFTAHWLAINGVQPDIGQNPSSSEATAAAHVESPSITGKRKRPVCSTGVMGGAHADPTELVENSEQSLTAEEQVWLEGLFEIIRAMKLNDLGRSAMLAKGATLLRNSKGDAVAIEVASKAIPPESAPGVIPMETDFPAADGVDSPPTAEGGPTADANEKVENTECFHPGGWTAVRASQAAGIPIDVKFASTPAAGDLLVGGHVNRTEEKERVDMEAREAALIRVLKAVASEASMHAYAAYFASFIAREVNANLTCLPLLTALMRFTQV